MNSEPCTDDTSPRCMSTRKARVAQRCNARPCTKWMKTVCDETRNPISDQTRTTGYEKGWNGREPAW